MRENKKKKKKIKPTQSMYHFARRWWKRDPEVLVQKSAIHQSSDRSITLDRLSVSAISRDMHRIGDKEGGGRSHGDNIALRWAPVISMTEDRSLYTWSFISREGPGLGILSIR